MGLSGKRMPVAAAIAAVVLPAVAQGSGFHLMTQNASGLGNAYAGHTAAAEDASTIYYNPAGLTRLPGRQASAALHAIRPSREFATGGASAAPAGLASPGGNGGDSGDLAAVPNAYFSWQFDPRWWMGVGISVPFGLKTEYEPGWFGRFQSRRSEVKTVDINPSVAVKLTEAVSLGFGVSYQKAEVRIERSVLLLLVPPAESFARIKADDGRFGWNAEAMFDLSPATRIGVSYRSSMEHTLTGTIAFSSVPGVGTAVNTVSAKLEFPDAFSWGIAHQLSPRWELLGDVTYTRWSRIKAVPLVTTSASAVAGAGAVLDTFNFQFKDSYRVGVGANWKWRDDFTVKLGVAYDRTPVVDAFRTVTLPDADRTLVAIGGKYRVSKQATLDFGYLHMFMKDVPINQSRGLGAVAGAQGNVIGRYEADVNIVSAQFTYRF